MQRYTPMWSTQTMVPESRGNYVIFSDASAKLSEAQRRVITLETALQAFYEAKKHEIHEIGLRDYDEDWSDEKCRDYTCQCHAPDNYVCIYCRAEAALRVGETVSHD